MTNPLTNPLTSPLLNSHCLENHPENSPIEHCTDFWDVIRSSLTSDQFREYMKHEQWAREDVEYLMRYYGRTVGRYMLRKNWKHLGGRPVLYHAQCHALTRYETDFDIPPAAIVELIREGVRAVTGREVYLVALSTDPAFYRQLKGWGFDAFTEYLIYSDTWANVMNLYRQYWAQGIAIAKETGLHYWVPVTTGFDASAWYDHPNRFVPTPEQFKAHLLEASEFALKNGRYTLAQVCIEAFNERGEGSYITPSIDSPEQLHPGDSMLRATRDALMTVAGRTS